MKPHELFGEYCLEEPPSGWFARSELGGHHLELLSAVRDCLLAAPLSAATRDDLISLKNRLRDAAEFENRAIKEYEGRLIAIADAILSGSA